MRTTKWKLVLVLAMVLILTLCMLAACNPKGQQSSSSGGQTPGGETPGSGESGVPGDGGNTPSGDGKTYFTVTFQTMGGTMIDSVQVEQGSCVSRPADPKKEGSGFVDWYDNSRFDGAPYDFSSHINADLTLYALWDDTDFIVTFDADGGNPIPKYASHKYGDTVEEPAALQRDGYTFDGWYLDASFSKQAFFPYKVTQSQVFYAKWTAENGFTVNFRVIDDPNNWLAYTDEVSGECLEPITVAKGQKVEQPEKPADIITANGRFTFNYWSFNDTYQTNQTRPILFPLYNTTGENITLYAVYELIREDETPAKITVHPNNGEKETIFYGTKGSVMSMNSLAAGGYSPLYTDNRYAYYEGHIATGYYKSQQFDENNVYTVPFKFEKEENDLYTALCSQRIYGCICTTCAACNICLSPRRLSVFCGSRFRRKCF